MACQSNNCQNQNPCRKCQQEIVTPSCELCEYIIPSKCITISNDVECANIEEGDTLEEALVKICEHSNDEGCPCPKGQYTINNVEVIDVKCGVGLGDQITILLNVTPNFNLTTPTFLNVFLQGEQDSNLYKASFNVFSEYIPNIQDGVSFNNSITLVIPSGFTQSGSDGCPEGYLLSVIDNEGNYSDEICLPLSDIQSVEDCNQ